MGGAQRVEVPIAPFSWGVLKRMGGKYLGRYRGLLAVYVAMTLITQSLLPVTAALLLKDITNHYKGGPTVSAAAKPAAENAPPPTPPPDSSAAKSAGSSKNITPDFFSHFAVQTQFFMWVGLVASLWVFVILTRYLQSMFDGKVGQSMREDVFASVLRGSPDFFIQYDKNRLNMIINQYTLQAQMGVRQLLIDPVVQSFSICYAGWALFGQIANLNPDFFQWIMLGCIAVFGVSAPWIVAFMAGRLQSAVADVQEQNLRLGTLVGNALNSPEEIQAMQAETFFDEKHAYELKNTLKFRLQQTFVMERLNTFNKLPTDIVVITLMALLVFFFGANTSVAGTILALLMLTPQFMGQVQALSSYVITRNMAWPSIAAINDILEQKSDLIEEPDAKDIESIQPTLEAKDVVFSYKPGKIPPCLNGFSLKLTPDKWTGLVGRSGQGKSTFFRLVLRFFDFQSGEITVGGIPIRKFSQASLRNHVSLMVQSPAFFYDTLRENMRVARPDATDDEIREACQITGIWDILVGQFGPNALDVQLAGGSALSGGQKRRLALSRGLLRKPSVFFLDEPTVGLNPSDKFPLIPILKKACAGKTVLLVEQDILWLEQICDYIVVLDQGKIVQQGTPAELSEQGGFYTKLRDSHLQQIKALTPAATPAVGKHG